MDRDKQLKVAIILIKRGDPIPLHRVAYLLSIGIDVAALERRYAQ